MPSIDVSRRDDVVVLTLNRPEARNALSVQMCDELVESLRSVPHDARVIVLRGAGPVFCSGADLADVSGGDPQRFLRSFEAMLETVARVPHPVIASIHGAALGGGLQLATVCDFRLCADSARLGIPSARLGVLVNFENVRRLVLLVGVSVAKEVLMTARTFTGGEAAAAGLVTRSVPDDDLDVQVGAMADSIAALAPLSVRGAKHAVGLVMDACADLRRDDPHAATEVDEMVRRAYESADLAEGVQALRERRPPRFSGR